MTANEGHSGLARCIPTREIGVRIIRAAHIAGVRRLATEALPWPSSSYQDESGQGGPEHHLHILQASEDFWDDGDGEAAREAHTRLEAELRALTVMLTARWGEPRTVDLHQYWPTMAQGGVLPEPLNILCQQVGSMQVWPLPGNGRWLALTIAQWDKELPYELLAAVGEASALA